MTDTATSGSTAVVHVVEDDAAARRATARLLEAAGFAVRTYADASSFLAADRDAGCVVLDLQLPPWNGLDVQQSLLRSNAPLPVVFVSGRADIADSVEAMKAGAIDFLEKSSAGQLLLEAVRRALVLDAQQRSERERRDELRSRYARLSPRERDVFAHLISGQLNKQVGFDLGISLQTTKIHRHRVLAKMQADSILDLARMAAELGIEPIGSVS